MAKPTAVNAKTQAAAIATALNAALHDTVLTGVFKEWKDPQHPMRKWQNFVKMDNQGTFTADDAYIDAAYVGNPYTKRWSEKDDRKTNAPS